MLIAACTAAFLVAWRRRWAVPVWAAVLIALGLRLAMAVLARGYTPEDVAVCFQDAGRLVLAGRDPLTQLPRYQWNFLPLMPYAFAAEIRTGVPWSLAAKLAPIAGDLAVTALLGRLVPGRGSGTAPLLYALCPVAVLVSAVHGQVEPVALALAIGALRCAQRGATVRCGLLAGLAVATKTWPVLLVFGMLRETPVRLWWRLLLPLGAVPLGLLLSVRLFLHDSVWAAVERLVSYRSLVGVWGWTGILNFFGIAGSGFAGPDVDRFQRIGAALLVVAMACVVLLRAPGAIALTAAILLTFLVVTAGFGVQYLLWPMPYVIALRRPSGLVFAVVASCYTTFVYLIVIPHPQAHWLTAIEQWACVPVILSALLALPSGPRRTGAHARGPGGSHRVLESARA